MVAGLRLIKLGEEEFSDVMMVLGSGVFGFILMLLIQLLQSFKQFVKDDVQLEKLELEIDAEGLKLLLQNVENIKAHEFSNLISDIFVLVK